MNYLLPFVFILAFSLQPATAQAQQGPYSSSKKKALQYYQDAEFYYLQGRLSLAVEALQSAITKDDDFLEPYLLLAKIYRGAGQEEKAMRTLKASLSIDIERPTFAFLQVRRAGEFYGLGLYDEAYTELMVFQDGESYGADQRKAAELMTKVDFAREQRAKATDIEPEQLPKPLNEFFAQYFVLPDAFGNLYFTVRAQSTTGASQWQEDIYWSQTTDDGWAAPESISDSINTQTFNEGTATVSADGRRMVFTICESPRGYGSCDLYESRKEGEDWSSPVNLGAGINSGGWESQASLSADGRTLYFVSNRQGGVGGLDIYMSHLQEDGSWGQARALCAAVNTSEDEYSPFIHANGVDLYFSSDGYLGMGGFDLFRSTRQGDCFSQPINLGYPINDHKDQFGFSVALDGERGFYSAGGTGSRLGDRSLLYTIELPQAAKPSLAANYLTGTVRDAETQEPLEASLDLVVLASEELLTQVTSDSRTGGYTLIMNEGDDYGLFASAEGYFFRSLNFTYETRAEGQNRVIDVYLDPIKQGTEIILNNIFFDLDKATLRPESVTELKRLKKLLEENPELRLQVQGHTDNQGSSDYNLDLSERRAKAVYDWLLSEGVEAKRLSYKGFGETEPVASNESEAGRQQNRRITFQALD